MDENKNVLKKLTSNFSHTEGSSVKGALSGLPKFISKSNIFMKNSFYLEKKVINSLAHVLLLSTKKDKFKKKWSKKIQKNIGKWYKS